MRFESKKAAYEVVSTLFQGSVNNCYVAGREDGSGTVLYTLLVLHEHEAVYALMEILMRWEPVSSALEGDQKEAALLDSFSNGKEYVLVFPYRPERELSEFYVGEVCPLSVCEEVCFNLILSCITAGLPYPLLYLVLEQGKINIARDNGIYLSYGLDLKELDRTRTERDCASKCADILLWILSSKESEKSIVYELLTKKAANKGYSYFTEIYRDLRIATAPEKKLNILQKIRGFFVRNADNIFGILFWVALIAAIIAFVLLLTNLVVGDIPFLRLFYNSFKKIGTESLAQ